MATKFTKDQIVRVNKTVPQGPIVKMRMDEDGKVSYMMQSTNAEGKVDVRWYDEDELVAVE
jgi:hypothetical protein